MAGPVDICSLDYLVGTMATAYKGAISSLIIRDLCMRDLDGAVRLTGTVLALPEGAYQARLMHEGAELARVDLARGSFVFSAPGSVIDAARNLQIDIIQGGRHIGTFLLKKEKEDGFYTSAMEVAADLAGINFASLASAVRERPGLAAKAEAIIAKVLSTKKDWRALSEQVAGFAQDLFWYDREAHHLWFGLLCRASVSACARLASAARDKSVSNVLSLLEPVLGNETDPERLRAEALTWLRELGRVPVPLSYQVHDTVEVVSALHSRLPELDIGPVLGMLLASLRPRLLALPVVDDTVIAAVRKAAPPDDLSEIGQYGRRHKESLIADLDASASLLEQKDYRPLFSSLEDIDHRLPDESRFGVIVLETIEKNLTPETADPLSGALPSALSSTLARPVPPDAAGRASFEAGRLIEKLARIGRPDICEQMLDRIGDSSPDVREETLLDESVAAAVLNAGVPGLSRRYTDIVKTIIIPPPAVSGFSGDTWAELVDPRHLRLLTKFLRTLRMDAEGMEGLLARVVCNLYLSGAFIPDDKLFQREVSAFLNSGACRRHFLLCFLLLKKLPVYFNEVGATGRIRDDSTEIDSWGNDQVLYFLRKQVHVNASNYNIRLIEAVLSAWAYNDPDRLAGAVPDDVRIAADRSLIQKYSEGLRPLLESTKAMTADEFHPERLHGLPGQEVLDRLEGMDISTEIKRKVFLLIRLYQQVVGKYSQSPAGEDSGDPVQEIADAVGRLAGIKETMTSPDRTKAEEQLFFKRHIAFGIPSVLGSYHEPKFDAAGELFRLDARIDALLEQTIAGLERGGDVAWRELLASVNTQLSLHGLANFQADEIVTILKTNPLRPSQDVDLLRIWQKELTGMVGNLSRLFHDHLTDLLAAFPRQDLPEHLRGLDRGDGDFVHKAVDVLVRDILSDIPGFTELDRLLAALIAAFETRAEKAGDAVMVPGEAPPQGKELYLLDGMTDKDAMTFAQQIGGKAKNLVYLHNQGLAVPSAVVLTADRTKEYEAFTGSKEFASVLETAVRALEDRTGRTFGGSEGPLFLAVRSGSYISMPGILFSILYSGMNETTREALLRETGDPRLAWDSFRRFIEQYAVTALGVDARLFQDALRSLLDARGQSDPSGLDATGMEELTKRYRSALASLNAAVPDDPTEQLKQCVKAVYRSWHDQRALQFRKALNVSERWGTSVMLMEMVPANCRGAGASVFFTRRPDGAAGIYGETRELATGDDLVSGGLLNRPLSRDQRTEERTSLEELDPVLFGLHRELAEKIERAMGGLPQEVEAAYVTKPDGKRALSVLQTRRMEPFRGFTRRFDDVCRMEASIIGRGIGAFGGALSGVASFETSREAIRTLRDRSGMPVILVRKTASTDDVSLMAEIGGVVTAAGGATSHAAVLARKFGVAAVVGCPALVISRDRNGRTAARIGSSVLEEGSPLSMDGSTGLLYSGTCLLTVSSS